MRVEVSSSPGNPFAPESEADASKNSGSVVKRSGDGGGGGGGSDVGVVVEGLEVAGRRRASRRANNSSGAGQRYGLTDETRSVLNQASCSSSRKFLEISAVYSV